MTTEAPEKNAPEVTQTPLNAYYYQPAYQYPSYWQQYQPMRSSQNQLVQVLFWVFYALVGFWVDLSLAVTLWVLALVLPFALPLTLILRNTTDSTLWVYDDGVRLYQMTDLQAYTAAGIITAIGIALLVVAIVTVKPMLQLHRTLFRQLGGVRI